MTSTPPPSRNEGNETFTGILHRNQGSSKRRRNKIPSPGQLEQVLHLSQKQAAKQLGVSLSTLQRRYREYFPNRCWKEHSAQFHESDALQRRRPSPHVSREPLSPMELPVESSHDENGGNIMTMSAEAFAHHQQNEFPISRSYSHFTSTSDDFSRTSLNWKLQSIVEKCETIRDEKLASVKLALQVELSHDELARENQQSDQRLTELDFHPALRNHHVDEQPFTNFTHLQHYTGETQFLHNTPLGRNLHSAFHNMEVHFDPRRATAHPSASNVQLPSWLQSVQEGTIPFSSPNTTTRENER